MVCRNVRRGAGAIGMPLDGGVVRAVEYEKGRQMRPNERQRNPPPRVRNPRCPTGLFV